ncbi:PH-like domain-containing protein [Nesterenkonia marinintestina]|uniref:PH-like domain-containing protein n=1 Tax=Nesterenkonia marinintestina TaxID=2979865 RepID=UPI0021BDF610|nr:hypothetical protein [Nesterenkonia sp. GX14115]
MTEQTQTYLSYLGVSLGIILLVTVLLWLGWRGRRRRQSGLPAPDEVPDRLLEEEPRIGAEGMVVGTVAAEDHLDRIAVHGLGLRSHGRIEVHDDGVAVLRAGARNYLIPREGLTHIRTDRGVVGKFVESDGVLIIGWRLGGTPVETAFRPRYARTQQPLLEQLQTIVEEETNTP